MAEKIPRWKSEAHIKAARRYRANNYRDIRIPLNINLEKEYIEIYDSIPHKREWFKEALRRYKDEH